MMYEIHGDWQKVKLHTLKRYLCQVVGIQPSVQVLTLPDGTSLDDDLETVAIAVPDGFFCVASAEDADDEGNTGDDFGRNAIGIGTGMGHATTAASSVVSPPLTSSGGGSSSVVVGGNASVGASAQFNPATSKPSNQSTSLNVHKRGLEAEL
jgi:hypothetical protein